MTTGQRKQNRYGKKKKPLRIAIPCFGEEVAPSFEAAIHFRIWHSNGGEIFNYVELKTGQNVEALSRIRLLLDSSVDVLICNGIKFATRKLLSVKGCKVIQSIAGPAADALYGYLAGKIIHNGRENHLPPGPSQPHTADLVQWTFELFTSYVWNTTAGSGVETLPVDLIAEKTCPVCKRPVRVAICCGAHAFRVDDEIREFHRVTASGFHNRIYVHQFLPGVANKCAEYGISLLDPITFSKSCNDCLSQCPLPPLCGNIAGHPQLNGSDNSEIEQINRGSL